MLPLRILVTGAAGFIGSSVVVEAASRGIDVVALARPEEPRVDVANVRSVLTDWRGEDLIRVMHDVRPSAIIHAAGHNGRFPAEPDLDALYEANVAIVWRLLAAVAVTDPECSVVMLSSAAVFGSAPPAPVTADAIQRPETHYASSKVIAERVASAFTRHNGLRVIVARPFNALGPGEPPGSVVSRIVEQLTAVPEGAVARVQLREAASTRDFVDVADVASALILLAEKGAEGRAYNICSGTPINIYRLAEMAAAAFGRQLDLSVAEPDAAGTVSIGDSTELEALGWAPRYSLADTLSRIAADLEATR